MHTGIASAVIGQCAGVAAVGKVTQVIILIIQTTVEQAQTRGGAGSDPIELVVGKTFGSVFKSQAVVVTALCGAAAQVAEAVKLITQRLDIAVEAVQRVAGR